MPSTYHKIKNHALALRDFLIDFIFPIECLDCGREGDWLCGRCFKKLNFSRQQYCLNCKKKNTFGTFCAECQPNYNLDGVWIAGDYENKTLAKLIKNMKYKFVRDIAKILGAYMSFFIKNMLNEHTIRQFLSSSSQPLWRNFKKINHTPVILFDIKNVLVIPVPLHKKRLRLRGFNQAAEIAKSIMHKLGLTLDSKNLIRTKHKKPQAKLKESERLINLKNCFKWQGDDLNDRKVIIVDDVVTTGATLNECAKVLKENGASEVWGLVAAKG